jgi:hypothetical protein
MKHQFQAYHAEDSMLAQQRIVDPTSSCSQCFAEGSHPGSGNPPHPSLVGNLANSISNNNNNNNNNNNLSNHSNNNNNNAPRDPSLLLFTNSSNGSSLNSSYDYNMDTDKIGGK